jgi:hypothetical protein
MAARVRDRTAVRARTTGGGATNAEFGGWGGVPIFTPGYAADEAPSLPVATRQLSLGGAEALETDTARRVVHEVRYFDRYIRLHSKPQSGSTT